MAKRICACVASELHDDKRPVPSASAGSKMSSVPVLIRGGHLSMRNLSMRTSSLLVAALLCCCIFPAAADDGKPRYLSGSGRDEGDCLNRFRPCRTLSYAISKAGKGDPIQVAEGTYSI